MKWLLKAQNTLQENVMTYLAKNKTIKLVSYVTNTNIFNVSGPNVVNLKTLNRNRDRDMYKTFAKEEIQMEH